MSAGLLQAVNGDVSSKCIGISPEYDRRNGCQTKEPSSHNGDMHEHHVCIGAAPAYGHCNGCCITQGSSYHNENMSILCIGAAPAYGHCNGCCITQGPSYHNGDMSSTSVQSLPWLLYNTGTLLTNSATDMRRHAQRLQKVALSSRRC